MTPLQTALAIILVICSIGLIIAILGQSAKSKRLGGAITGGAETFLGKEKGKKADILLNKVTTVLVILLALLTLAIYVFQPEKDKTGTTSTPASITSTVSTEVSKEASEAGSVAESTAVTSEASAG